MRRFLTALLFLAASTLLSAQDAKLYAVTHIDAEPNYTKDATNLLRTYASDSRKDPGAVRIEVLEEDGKPNHFTLVEVWRDKKAYEAHIVLAHTKEFRAKLFPMLGSPYDERLHAAVN